MDVLAVPCSMKAARVASGMVLTVSVPMSVSTYRTSLYSGFLVLVDAHSGLCTLAPRSAIEWNLSVPNVSLKSWYAILALATAALPRRWSSAPSESAIRPSTDVSTRLTKNDATDDTRDGSPPDATRSSRPAMYASRTRAYMASEKMRVTLTLIPLPIRSRIAGMPSGVAGTLIMTLGRSSVRNSRRAASIVPLVSCARCGLTSSEAKPSAPRVPS